MPHIASVMWGISEAGMRVMPTLETSLEWGDERWQREPRPGEEEDKKKEIKAQPPLMAQWVLTFRLHQLLHNILLALVKRELAWEVEAFFALYFDWLLVRVWRRGNGGNERAQTKTEWVSMKLSTLTQKQKQKKGNKWNARKQHLTVMKSR